MKRMLIFEPAMCCETGLCGVSIDPELLRVSTAVNALKGYGAQVERFNLNSAPMEFVTNAVINKYINEKGPEGLPAVMVDDEIVIAGRYPSNAELTRLLDLPEDVLKEAEDDAAKRGACCEGDKNGSCC